MRSSSSSSFSNLLAAIILAIASSQLRQTSGLILSMSAAAASSTSTTLGLEKLTSHANSYAAAHGVQVETKSSSSSSTSSSYQCAPISLLPNAYPASAFRKAKSLATPFNLLVDRISRDSEFLQDTLEDVGTADPYTGTLLRMYKEIYLSPQKGKFANMADRLGVFRSDYMLNPSPSTQSSGGHNEYELKQVELNTIASSFAGLSVNVAGLHRQLVTRFGDTGEEGVKEWLECNKRIILGDNADSSEEADEGVPVNPALACIPAAMNVAHQRYASRFVTTTTANKGPVVLFIVQEGETNTVDQRMLEFKLWDNHSVPVVRMSLTRAHTDLALNEETGALTISSSNTEVSVVYYRAGYAPTDYPDGDDGAEWKAREKIECSRSTKCPSLGYHLAGTKKVQQELARGGVVERFFPEQPAECEAMRGAFAGLYSLGQDATDIDKEAVMDALNGNEGKYVLKPQREGGGYNYYGEDLKNKLQKHVTNQNGQIELGTELAEFILMQRLFPPNQRAVLLRGGQVEADGDTISELGCFGTMVASEEGEVMHNEFSGFLLRTKGSKVDEGGVASGFATLSSPYLC